MNAGYDAVVFDVGGTLLDITRDAQQAAVDAIAHLGSLSVQAYAAGIRQAQHEWLAAGGAPDREDLRETWLGHNRRALELVGFRGNISMAAELLEDAFLADGWQVFPDVTGALAAVRARGLRLAVVSNWPATLEATLERVALREHFEVIVASGNVGYAKPHPRIFSLAAERLSIAPGRALYVGDSFEHDVVGARAAGMDVVLLDRLGCNDSNVPRLRSLSQLAELLDRGASWSPL